MDQGLLNPNTIKSVYSTSSRNIRFLVKGRRYLELNALDTWAGVWGQAAKVYDIQIAITAVFHAGNALTKIRQLPPGERPQSKPYHEYEVVRRMLHEAGLSELLNREDAQHALMVLGTKYPARSGEDTRPSQHAFRANVPSFDPGQSTSAGGFDNTKSTYHSNETSGSDTGSRGGLDTDAGSIDQSAEPVIEYRTPVKKPLWDSHGSRLCSSVNLDDQPPEMEQLVNRSDSFSSF
ncbi:hypothetical protein CKAH01_01370 [Colletotrichum kahawae]|uniref:Uncharacterized protein n=1 Tax=Colletotrichum kahawae TaxID=34407 RepID=A0AAD9Y7Z0_COLKA|nr:hypothetical protein CKAH01_01370 [Colletotrichum kahawae]